MQNPLTSHSCLDTPKSHAGGPVLNEVVHIYICQFKNMAVGRVEMDTLSSIRDREHSKVSGHYLRIGDEQVLSKHRYRSACPTSSILPLKGNAKWRRWSRGFIQISLFAVCSFKV